MEKASGGWHEIFPFVAGFEVVVEQEVTLEYVRQVACVLEPAVNVLAEVVERGEVTETSVRSLFFLANALARCQTVLAYEEEIVDAVVDRDELLAAVTHEWERLVDRECMVSVEYAPDVGLVIGDSIERVWYATAMERIATAASLVQAYPAYVAGTCVVPVAQVLVVDPRGKPLRELDSDALDKPVMPAVLYRALVERVVEAGGGSVRVEHPHDMVEIVRDGVFDVGYGPLAMDRVMAWLWLLVSKPGGQQGYCYQLLYPPCERYGACMMLGARPVVQELLWHLDTVGCVWSARDAVIDWGAELHVCESGNPDVQALTARLCSRIGMLRGGDKSAETDYYARALVDEFIKNHRPVVPVPPPPLDAELESLSISSDSGVGREFVDVAKMMYGAINEVISPRAEQGDGVHAGAFAPDDHHGERDTEIVQELYDRLADGAVIHEEYFYRTYRRFRNFRRRPRLDRSDGNVYHVFEGFPADGGSGLGPWELDHNWGVPGWRSYVAVFEEGENRTVSFTADTGCQDVRMDCSGRGTLVLGDCRVAVAGTLLWFTNSIRLSVRAKSSVSLRVSVPDALGAMAIGAEMRRYMHIPGYTVAVRSFDVITARATLTVPMERVRRDSVAGCHVYSGEQYVERGRHCFRLSQLVSTAPAKLLFKTEPPDALQYVGICGMSLYPRTRDHVSALVDLRNVEMVVTVTEGATFAVSMVQIVRAREYELAVISANEARLAQARN